MNKLKYLIKRIFTMNYKNFFKTLKKVKKKSKKPYIYLFFDIIYCGIKYQAGYVDYDLFSMYKLTKNEREKIITRGKNNQYIKKLNPKEYWDIVDNKKTFNDTFKKYLNRDYLLLNDNYDEYQKLITKHKKFIAKPLSATGGHGVEVLEVNKKNEKKVYNNLIKHNQTLLEELVDQHEIMNKLHKPSVNTIRVITINNGKRITIAAAVLRIGTNNNRVDNFHSEGICCPVNIETGRVEGTAVNIKAEQFTKHPTTNIELLGFQIPLWKEVKELVTNAAKEIPQLKLIGWDVAIAKDGPCLIEANQFPGHDLYSMIKTPNNIGMVKVFDNAIKVNK